MTLKTSTPSPMFYLFKSRDFASFLLDCQKYDPTFSTITEELEIDAENDWMLYCITTSLVHLGMNASAICTPDGNFVKNRFTGEHGYNPQLPEGIQAMFDRHFTPMMLEVTPPQTLIGKVIQWFKKSAGGSETK